MTSLTRILPLSMCRRKKKQLTFIISVIVCLSVLSFLQYIITIALNAADSHSGSSSNAAAAAAAALVPLDEEQADDNAAQELSEDKAAAAAVEKSPINRRALGVAMPTLDYAAFKDLESRKAPPNDPQVLRVARDAMLEPAGRARLKIRSVRKTPQADMVDKILRNRTNGFFVECGAFDGETASNTAYLERTRSWTGLLVEMDSAFYTQLVGKQRNAWSINACLTPERHVVEMKYFESNGQLGRMADSPADQRRAARLTTSAFCFPLESLLLALDRTHVDYFSLDVEGFELSILRSIPFDRLDIDVVSAEFLHSTEPHSTYIDLMASYGYKLNGQINNMDYVFVKKSVMTAAASSKEKRPSVNHKALDEADAERRRPLKQIGLRHVDDEQFAAGDGAAAAVVVRKRPRRQQQMEVDDVEPAVDDVIAAGQDADGQNGNNDAMIIA